MANLKRISSEVFEAAVAARDVDALIELLRPYVAKPPGRRMTVGLQHLSPDAMRRYNAERKKIAREKRRNLQNSGDS